MQKILILDLGGPYTQHVARRVRECHVYCEVFPAARMTVEAVRAFDPIGIILSGGTAGVSSPNAPRVDKALYALGIPVLGICYAGNLIALDHGGTVEPGEDSRCHSRTLTKLDTDHVLFREHPEDAITWMCNEERITSLPEGFTVTASTANCPVAAFACEEKGLYGVRFHPEVPYTKGGVEMVRQFLYRVCGAVGDWHMETYAAETIQSIRERVGDGNVVLALSGGVDSSVAAALLSNAVGSRLTCIFVDHGMLRKDEGDQVEAIFSRMDLNFIRVNAREQFLSRLAGVTDPEEKRHIIGEEFLKVFEAEAARMGAVDFLAQGTIYPDVTELCHNYADVLQSPHKTGIHPEHIRFKELLEPLRPLFKEEVRALGRTMGLPETLVNRQPFPGPGLAIRIIGEITPEKIRILQEADHIFRSHLESAHIHDHITQYFAVLTDTQTIDITGADRSPKYILALRGVTTDDFMTAKWARLPYELLDNISHTIIQNVPEISRVVYDITSKPPATIEWE